MIILVTGHTQIKASISNKKTVIRIKTKVVLHG